MSAKKITKTNTKSTHNRNTNTKGRKTLTKRHSAKFILIRKIIFTAISTFAVLFIFSNSLQNGSDSTETSSSILNWFQNLNLGINITEHFIRKLGHFFEFFIFGALMTSTIYIYTNDIIGNIFVALFFGLLVPVCDETIQIFSEGRTALVSDILLDFSGVITGLIVAYLIIFIFKRKKKS